MNEFIKYNSLCINNKLYESDDQLQNQIMVNLMDMTVLVSDLLDIYKDAKTHFSLKLTEIEDLLERIDSQMCPRFLQDRIDAFNTDYQLSDTVIITSLVLYFEDSFRKIIQLYTDKQNVIDMFAPQMKEMTEKFSELLLFFKQVLK